MTLDWMRVPDGDHRVQAGHRRGNLENSFSVLEFRVLGLLKDREMYAKEIVKSLSAQEEFGEPPGSGTVYPLLKDLVKEGVLISRRSHGPLRVYFSLTASGTERLHATASRWVKLHQAVQSLLSDTFALTESSPQ